jgi:tRNA(Ile)-lysidine synthase
MKHKLLTDFLAYAQEQKLPIRAGLLLAVSGGLDSMVLVDLCLQAGISFEVAHVNFQLRGAESQRDEDFIQAYCLDKSIPFHIHRVDTFAQQQQSKQSIQALARSIRYAWFSALLDAHPHLHVVATAHHGLDQAETILLHLARGTGMEGMKGMLPQTNRLIRPLLFATRLDIEQYAVAQGIKWVEDSSNHSDGYTRNFIRHQIIPLFEDKFPAFVHTQMANANRFRELSWLSNRALMKECKRLVKPVGVEQHLSVLGLLNSPVAGTILHHVTQDKGFQPAQIPDMIELLRAENSKMVLSDTHRIFRNRKWLILSPIQSAELNHMVLESPSGAITLPEGELIWNQKSYSGSFPTHANQAWMDARNIQFPLMVRRPKIGDYFYPLGMSKKKKISRFMIDLKYSLTEKEKAWILCAQDKVIWLIGKRMDDRWKLSPASSDMICFEWKPFKVQ